jgi:hypothetical protein
MAENGKTPWHLWVVGGLSLLWNAFGATDFTMTQLQGDAWLRSMKMTEPAIAYFNAMPVWMHVVWGVGVLGALLGSVLLLLRRRLAAPVFVISFVGFLVSLVYTYVLSDGASVMPENTWIMQVVIGAACVVFILYARHMSNKGVLR